MHKLLRAFAVSVALAGAATATEPVVPPPPALTLDAVPQVPVALRAATQPYMEFRTASFQGWDPKGGGMIIATRFGNAAQVHRVSAPGAMREQLTFEPEPVPGGSFAPVAGDVLLVGKDEGGDENFQFFRVESGRLMLLTDGKSRNTAPTWSQDGRLIGFSSNARNGRDSDLWLMDPRNPAARRMVAEREGGGWSFADFAPDGRTAIIRQYVSVTDSRLFRLDLESAAAARRGGGCLWPGAPRAGRAAVRDGGCARRFPRAWGPRPGDGRLHPAGRAGALGRGQFRHLARRHADRHRFQRGRRVRAAHSGCARRAGDRAAGGGLRDHRRHRMVAPWHAGLHLFGQSLPRRRL
ncbi:MAG: TolB family protein [Thermaurantiacus sp.]